MAVLHGLLSDLSYLLLYGNLYRSLTILILFQSLTILFLCFIYIYIYAVWDEMTKTLLGIYYVGVLWCILPMPSGLFSVSFLIIHYVWDLSRHFHRILYSDFSISWAAAASLHLSSESVPWSPSTPPHNSLFTYLSNDILSENFVTSHTLL